MRANFLSVPGRLPGHLSVAFIAVFLISMQASQLPSRPETFTVKRNLVYSSVDGQDLHADLYIPTAGGSHPGVITIHSGSWTRGNKDRMSPLARQLARENYVVMNINYRLAPEHRFPAALEDARAALDWLRANADQYKLKADKVAVFGYSAGAHIALMLAYSGTAADQIDALKKDSTTEQSTNGQSNQKHSGIQAVVAGGAPSDLSQLPDVAALRNLTGSSRSKEPDLYKQASPISHIDARDPPTYLYHGRWDWIVPVHQSRRLFKRLQAAGVPVFFKELGRGHGTTYLSRYTILSLVLPFLKQQLR